MTEITVGQRINLRDLHDTPIGTLFRGDYGTYQHEPDGWHTPGDSVLPLSSTMNGVVEFVGTREVEQETLAQYKQRFHSVCIGRARQSSVSLTPVVRALRTLRTPELGLYQNMYVHRYDRDLLSMLPDKTLLICGDPTVWDRWGLWYIRGGGLGHLLGAWTRETDRALRVVQYPEGTITQPWPEASGDQIAAINEFKTRAWEIGVRAKSESGWCGDFESAMGRMGIDRRIVTALSGGIVTTPRMVVDHAEMDTMPVGTQVQQVIEATGDFTGAIYHKCENGLWSATSDGRGQHRATAFTGPSWGYAHVPGPAVTVPRVGMMLVAEQVAALPLGAVLRWTDPSNASRWAMFVRAETTRNASHTLNLVSSNGNGEWSGTENEVLYTGVGPMSIPVRNYEEMDRMCAGTTVLTANGVTWTKREDGTWVSERGRVRLSAAGFRLGPRGVRYTLIVGPDRAAATVRSGLTHPVAPDGGEVCSIVVASHAEMDTMPVGTEISQGEIVWVKQENGSWPSYNRAAGRVNNDGVPSTSFFLSDSFRYTRIPRSARPTEAEPEAVPSAERADGTCSIVVASHEEMDRMPVGTRITQSGSTWEKVANGTWPRVHGVGTSGPSWRAQRFHLSDSFRYTFIPPALPGVGQVLRAEQVAALPAGAVLRWMIDPEERPDYWVMYRRVDDGGYGVSRTVQIAASGATGHHAGSNNEVLYSGVGDMLIPVRSSNEMDAMPVGTVVSENTAWWVKQSDGTWAYNGGSTTSPSRSFRMNSNFGYSHIPGPGAPGEVATPDDEPF